MVHGGHKLHKVDNIILIKLNLHSSRTLLPSTTLLLPSNPPSPAYLCYHSTHPLLPTPPIFQPILSCLPHLHSNSPSPAHSNYHLTHTFLPTPPTLQPTLSYPPSYPPTHTLLSTTSTHQTKPSTAITQHHLLQAN